MKLTKRSLLAGIALGVFALATPALAEPVTLKVWSIDGANAPGIADVMSKEFDDANEDIVVEYRVVPFDDLVQESLRAFATGQAPDIVSFDNPDFAMFSSRGAMLDITDRVKASSVIKTDAYFAGPLNMPRGVVKFRTIEEMQADRQKYEQQRIERLRAERQPK